MSEIILDKKIKLYGPPGTGKTYNTVIYAVAICDGLTLEKVRSKSYEEVLERYRILKDKEKRIAFTTFHQSYGYEEFIEGIKDKIFGKTVGLFGSYDWGTGEWMETWKQNAESEGVNVVETFICNLEPDDEALEALRGLAAKLSA